MSDRLDLEETRQMFLAVARQMIASQELLSQADRAIGDGDHGTGMRRGFAAVQDKLNSFSGADLAALFNAIGMALITSVGGAAGVIFGTWLRGGAKELAGETVFDARALERFLSGGLVAVQQRGKANLGDKTMLDALAPAAEAAQSMANAGLAAALAEAVSAAGQGVEHTRTLVAMTGKAKALGQRSLGYADPGAISTHLILKFMYEFVAGR